MIVNVENSADSVLVIEYNNIEYKIGSNQIYQIDVDSAEFQLSAYYELIETVDLELNTKRIKYRFIQKAVDKLIKFGKQLIIQTKAKYNIKLKDNSTIKFEFGAFGKDTNFVQELFDMPAELIGFARLECDNADINVLECEAINKKDFLKIYRRTYLWINWNAGIIFSLILYLPSYIKQKVIISNRHLKKKISKLYSVTPEEREKLIDIETDDDEMDENTPKENGGCLKTFIILGLISLAGFVLVAIILILIFKGVIVTHNSI